MANNQDKSSATWSRADVATLVHTLAGEKAKGNWVDNRPKAVAWTSCEFALSDSERKSGGGVKTLHSIQNRWQRLKLEFNIVKELRVAPGFRWNDQEQRVRASREIWDTYIKASSTHPAANKFRKKPFLLYDTIAYLVDGTQAMGQNAFQAGQKRERSSSLGSCKYSRCEDHELATTSPRPPDRMRSNGAGTTTVTGRQKIRRLSAGQGMSEIADSSVRKMTDAQTQTTR
ncbi:hypothetical protein EI94DRAFT_1825613 [Lactarius quietus]|nr:hypothetical protein EI94DRAFT_1825613 [Lactarius quietus]